MGLRALAIDVTPLRSSRDFRLLWFGHAVSFTGSVITTVALSVSFSPVIELIP